jgi:pimeloyl-ACP methyl ester carboxylesterase
MGVTAVKKSTIVRTIRGVFRALEPIAPRLGARLATRMWFRLPAPLPAGPLPEGGTPFEVSWEHHVVRGHVWGDGPVVYLVHGWGGRGDQFSAFVPALVRAGHRVVMFDGPSHGTSDPGEWRRSTHGVELAKALDAVAARFGPAHTVLAHSMGAVVTMLAVRHGWLGSERLALVAPMSSYADAVAPFRAWAGLGPRTSRHFDDRVWRRVGVAPEDFDLRRLLEDSEAVPTLLVHDRRDRQTSHVRTAALAGALPDARLVTTSGLGHNRILRDPSVVAEVVGFVTGATPELSVSA